MVMRGPKLLDSEDAPVQMRIYTRVEDCGYPAIVAPKLRLKSEKGAKYHLCV